MGRWLTYWVTFGFFMTIEPVLAIITDLFPYYKFVKLIFFVWMIHGSTNGYLQVFHYVIGPLISQFDADIQQAIEQTQSFGQKLHAQGQKMGGKLLEEQLNKAFTQDQVNQEAARSKIDERLNEVD